MAELAVKVLKDNEDVMSTVTGCCLSSQQERGVSSQVKAVMGRAPREAKRRKMGCRWDFLWLEVSWLCSELSRSDLTNTGCHITFS